LELHHSATHCKIYQILDNSVNIGMINIWADYKSSSLRQCWWADRFYILALWLKYTIRFSSSVFSINILLSCVYNFLESLGVIHNRKHQNFTRGTSSWKILGGHGKEKRDEGQGLSPQKFLYHTLSTLRTSTKVRNEIAFENLFKAVAYMPGQKIQWKLERHFV